VKNLKLKPLSPNTFRKVLRNVTSVLEDKIADTLPNSIGIMLDGWSNGSEHFIALFALYEKEQILLNLSTLPDETNLTAQSHQHFIDVTLQKYKKTLSNIIYLVGDNVSLNRRLANDIGVSLVGCAAHRLNLACEEYLQSVPEIAKVHSLMMKLKDLKPGGWLRTKTRLKPISRNKTRWLSAYSMIQRYIKLEPHLRENVPLDVRPLLLSYAEHAEILEVFAEVLKPVHSVQVVIQGKDISLIDSRNLFDGLITDFGAESPHAITSFNKYLATDSHIIHNPDFENGVCKVLRHSEERLNENEIVALRKFKILESERPQQVFIFYFLFFYHTNNVVYKIGK
jgi:hypothetical protein